MVDLNTHIPSQNVCGRLWSAQANNGSVSGDGEYDIYLRGTVDSQCEAAVEGSLSVRWITSLILRRALQGASYGLAGVPGLRRQSQPRDDPEMIGRPVD